MVTTQRATDVDGVFSLLPAYGHQLRLPLCRSLFHNHPNHHSPACAPLFLSANESEHLFTEQKTIRSQQSTLRVEFAITRHLSPSPIFRLDSAHERRKRVHLLHTAFLEMTARDGRQHSVNFLDVGQQRHLFDPRPHLLLQHASAAPLASVLRFAPAPGPVRDSGERHRRRGVRCGCSGGHFRGIGEGTGWRRIILTQRRWVNARNEVVLYDVSVQRRRWERSEFKLGDDGDDQRVISFVCSSAQNGEHTSDGVFSPSPLGLACCFAALATATEEPGS